MKAFRVIYKHGQFIDLETQQRLIPVQGAEYIISADDNAFKTEDSKLNIGDILSQKEKQLSMENEHGSGNYILIMKAGEQLFFRVGNSKKVEGDENHAYIFTCTLLEDLYLYLKRDKKGDKEEDWRLAECKCILDSCLNGGLTLTEKIPAKSLNAIFSNTVQFYFSLQRSSSANTFDTFYKYEKGMRINFDDSKKGIYFKLSDIRKEMIKYR